MRTLLKPILLLWLIVAGFSVSESQVKPTLAIVQDAAKEAGLDAASRLQIQDSSHVSVNVHPDHSAWYIRTPFELGLESSGHVHTMTGGGQPLEVTLNELSVRYDQLRRTGFFGGRIVDRIITVRILTASRNSTAGSPATPIEFKKEVRDTVLVSSVPALEESSVPATHGTLPDEGFFDWFLEPFILVGAVAVSVYLLYQVRS
jgi:hypothetical protein